MELERSLGRDHALAPVQAEASAWRTEDCHPAQAGALSTGIRVQLSVPGTRWVSPGPLLQEEQNRGLRGRRA